METVGGRLVRKIYGCRILLFTLAKIAKHAKEGLSFGEPVLNKAIRILLADPWNGLPEMTNLVIAFLARLAIFARAITPFSLPIEFQEDPTGKTTITPFRKRT